MNAINISAGAHQTRDLEIARLREIDAEIALVDSRLAALPRADQLDPRSLAAADRNQLTCRRNGLQRLRREVLDTLFRDDDSAELPLR